METPAKRRKVRRGTHSCWECRRRKIRCKFATEDDAVCIGCQGRSEPCVSQDVVVEAPSSDAAQGVSDRLQRLESLMEQIIKHSSTAVHGSPLKAKDPNKPVGQPDQHDRNQSLGQQEVAIPTVTSTVEASSQPPSRLPPQTRCQRPNDLLDASAAGSAFTALHRVHEYPADGILTPETSTGHATPPAPSVQCTAVPRWAELSRKLHTLLPSASTIAAMIEQVPSIPIVFSIIHGRDDHPLAMSDARREEIVSIPKVSSHPALIAKKLLILTFCLQQLPYDFDMTPLHSDRSSLEIINSIMCTVTREVTSHDDIVANLEGVECLMLLSLIYSDAGLIRKAWMAGRRALNLQQLLGINRKDGGRIRSCDPDADPARQVPASLLWYRVNDSDRFRSLILGLPIGSRDNTWASQTWPGWDLPHDSIGRAYTVIAGKISDRNELSGEEAWTLTKHIDTKLEDAKTQISQMRWDTPELNRKCDDAEHFMPELSKLKLQTRHWTLTILTHLPYLLRDQVDPECRYSRQRCLQASRAIVRRFLDFRNPGSSAISGRSIDYSALVASMTLIMAHKDRTYLGADFDEEASRNSDYALARGAQETMTRISQKWGDKLAGESADLLVNLLKPQRADTGSLRMSDNGSQTVYDTSPTFGTDSQPLQSSSSMDFAMSDHLGNSEFPGMTGDMQTADWNWLGTATDLGEWALEGANSLYWSMLNGES